MIANSFGAVMHKPGFLCANDKWICCLPLGLAQKGNQQIWFGNNLGHGMNLMHNGNLRHTANPLHTADLLTP